MQTFLPYPSFTETARVLDRQRLGKQRVETFQLLKALNGETRGWANHPAARMWIGHERSLVEYGVAMSQEWKSRGYKDTMEPRIAEYASVFADASSGVPGWFGDPDFHRSHQSNLVRKMPEHYAVIFPNVPNDLPYVWPV